MTALITFFYLKASLHIYKSPKHIRIDSIKSFNKNTVIAKIKIKVK